MRSDSKTIAFSARSARDCSNLRSKDSEVAWQGENRCIHLLLVYSFRSVAASDSSRNSSICTQMGKLQSACKRNCSRIEKRVSRALSSLTRQIRVDKGVPKLSVLQRLQLAEPQHHSRLAAAGLTHILLRDQKTQLPFEHGRRCASVDAAVVVFSARRHAERHATRNGAESASWKASANKDGAKQHSSCKQSPDLHAPRSLSGLQSVKSHTVEHNHVREESCAKRAEHEVERNRAFLARQEIISIVSMQKQKHLLAHQCTFR